MPRRMQFFQLFRLFPGKITHFSRITCMVVEMPFFSFQKLAPHTFYLQAYKFFRMLNTGQIENRWHDVPDISKGVHLAATLGLLGRFVDGKKFVKNLLELRPDYKSRGRVLIGHYVKFDEITECIIEGLQRSGIDLE